MVIYYATFINILEKINTDSNSIFMEMENMLETDSALVFSSDLAMLLDYAKSVCSQPPLSNANRCGDLLRHLHFSCYYSQKEPSISGIRGNLRDVIYYDIPAMKKSVMDYLCSLMDTELFQETQKRLEIGDYTSAVRAAFVLLSNRLRNAFNIPASVNDGGVLIDSAFSQRSEVKFRTGQILTAKEKESFKFLLKGLYYLIRNDVAHETFISFEQADASLATINYVLRTLEI